MEGANLATMRGWRAATLGRVGAGLALLCALLASPALAQTSASAESQVAIQEPLSVLAVQDMDFGQIVTDGTAGTVVLDPSDQTCTASAGLVHTGPCRAAIFSGYTVGLWWLGGLSFIRIDAPDIVELTGPGDPMELRELNFSDDTNMLGSFGDTYLVSDSNGLFEIRFGGTLHVGANQAPGEYSGTITVSIAYN